MPPTTPERYAVASCHVERPLDDRVWSAFAALQERRPGGLSIAALIRPPDAVAGEHDDERWLARAREAAERGPLGHHVHFTSPTHARPTGDPTGERVQREGLWLREHGLRPTLFCGGGWYTDHTVALACAELGYADCTPRRTRPPYLPGVAAWAELSAPARIDLGDTVLVAVPTTHGAGDLARALVRPGLPRRVHAYFHDTDLIAPRRRALIVSGLALLGRLRPATDLDRIALSVRDHGPTVTWAAVARGEAAAARA
ncbi:MAG TPA: hypothetical protein VHH57_03300 [Gaiella sp.]|jgi:hypothetical protein|nr:hypothetical protein [Gaiella sp.]